MQRLKYSNTELFESAPIARTVLTMAVPTVIGQLIVLFYNIADTFFLGRTGNPFMVAGASLILPIYNITLSIASLTGVGGGALISRLLGEKNHSEIRRVYSFTLYVSSCLALLFSLSTALFMDPLMDLLGADQDTFSFARDYAFCVIVFGGLPTVMSNAMATLLRSVGESKKAGFGVTMGGLINIALDPLFMFVLFPKGQEIVGAGVATCISNCITCLYFIITLCRLKGVLRLSPPSLLPSRKSLTSIFVVGIPSCIATLLFDLDCIVIDRLMSAYRGLALAAIGIVLKVERLPLNIGLGICYGMVPIVAYNYSSGNLRRMNEVRIFSRRLGLICSAVSIVLYLLFAGPIIRFFIDNETTAVFGTAFLRIRCIAAPLMFLSFFHVHLFNGFGEGKYALFLGVMRWAAFNIPMLFLLDHFFGMYGIVWSQLAADVFTVSLSFFVYWWFEKRKQWR